MKVLFLLRSMCYGGAERQVVILAKGLRKRGHDAVVAVFYSGGPLEKELCDAGVPIRLLHKRGRWDVLGVLVRFARLVKQEKPDILHGYLFEPNLLGLTLKLWDPSTKVVWGVRTSNWDFSGCDWLDHCSFRMNCWLSRFPDGIIANSEVGRDFHVSHGFPLDKVAVIRNGVNTERFQPNPAARDRMRSEWGVAGSEKLIGLVGRLNPQKDHPNFLQAAACLIKSKPDTRFVCVGEGPQSYTVMLHTLAKKLGLAGHLIWAGARQDMPAVFNALDVGVSSSSYGEGLSNAIGEAMACGVPCVVTDVGDSAWIVGDLGEVVPPKNPVALKNGIDRILNRKPYEPMQIRARIVDELSEDNLVLSTEHALYTLVQASASR
jgi:glycosyltransferase involved in cell wall biosynthesis